MTEPGDRKLDEEVERLLGEAGPFANSKRFRVRSGQVAMAGAVARTLMNDSILLCEAGTGTGKTLGYLLPAILSGQRVILSTATKALEDQILEREVPLVEQVLGIKASIHVAKGLSNYLCRRRLGELEAAVMRQQPTTREVRRALPMIRDWVTSTRTGDRAEMGELSEEDPIVEKSFSIAQRAEMMAGCDYLLVAAPLTGETRGLVGATELAGMKSSAVVINVGRGPVIDEAALIAALQNGTIKGAALDVFDKEPLPDGHAFWGMQNVLLSPHCADHTATWTDEAMQFFLENLKRFQGGQPLLNLVDKKSGY